MTSPSRPVCFWSMIMSFTRPVMRRISQVATRPLPSAWRTSRWGSAPFSVPAIIARACWCWWGGKKSMRRLTVSAASTVWTVEKTRWPVSAALSAVCTVSSSRISPMRMTSGSWRRTRRSARLKDDVSIPTSRWLMSDCLSRWRNSIGSSIVTMCRARVELMWSIIAASVVDLPEPVVPVSSTMPRSSSARSRMTGGRSSCSIERMSTGIARMTSDVEPRCLKALTRKRATPGIEYEKSTSLSSANSASLLGSSSIWRTAPSVSSPVRRGRPAIARMTPSTRMTGGAGTLRCRSEPPASMRWRRQKSRSKPMPKASAGARRSLTGVGRNDDGPLARGPSTGLLRSASARLRHVAELLRLRERLQLLQRLVLDLADALARHVERAAHLVERAGMLAAEPVAQLEHPALAVGEVLERLPEGFLREDLRGALVRRLGPLVGDELAELGLLLVADRLLERDRGLRGALDRVDLLGVDPRDLGDLLGRGLAPELGDELALGPPDLVELLHHVDRDANRARLVGEGPRDRLPDPPGRIGRELEALAVVELLRRANETERALLDEVEERQSLVSVVLRDGDDEPQVGLDHLLLRVEVAALDPLGEIDLLLRREQTDLADVLQEQLKGVGRHVGPQIQLGLGLAPLALVRGPLHLLLGGGGGRIDVLDQLDLRLLEEAVKLLDVGLVEIELGDRVGDLGEREHADLLALRHQALDLFELLQFDY